MNKAVLIGRLGRDPELKYTQGNNTAIARFSIAVDRRFAKDGEQAVDFINCLAFGKTAEFIDKYFTKGMRIAVDGRIQTGSYKDKDGKTVYTTDIVVENCEFCDRKQDAGNAGTGSGDGFMQIPDSMEEELPFN